MKRIALITVLISGALLYSLAVYVGGYLAAIAIPSAYFDFFGANKVLALVVEEAFVYALPIFVLAAVWGYVSIRPLRATHRKATLWCLVGVAAAWLGWTLQTLAYFASNPSPNQFPLEALALQVLVPPVWALLNLAAVPCGVMFAGWLVGRSNSSPQRMYGGAA